MVRHPGITASAALAILVISLFGAFQVVVDNDNANYFLKDSDIFVSTQKLDTDAAGSSVINLMQTSSSSETEPFKKPENLLFAEELSGFLETRPDVGKLLGLTRLIRRVNQVMHEDDPAFDRIPAPASGESSKNLVSQLLFLYENAGGDALSDFTDTGYTRLNIPVILKTNSSARIYQVTRDVREFVRTRFPDHLKVDVGGSANVSVAATDEIVKGQMTGLIVSFVLVFWMLLLTFKKEPWPGIRV